MNLDISKEIPGDLTLSACAVSCYTLHAHCFQVSPNRNALQATVQL